MKHFVCLCLGAALLAACHKDDDVVECAPAVAPATFADLRATAPAVQTFTFDLNKAQTFSTRAGATLAFGANVFILPNRQLATGQAQLRVREIYSVPDMVLANLPTTAASSRQVLISGGEFDIQVWQGSTRLRLYPGWSANGAGRQVLKLTSPVPPAGLDTTPMLLWQQPAAAPSVAGTISDSSAWQLRADSTGRAIQVTTTTGPATTASYYNTSLPLDSLSLWNLDQFWHAYSANSSGPIGVTVPFTSTTTGTRVYFRPVGYNGLARGYASSAAPTTWSSYLPYGADVIAIVLQEREGLLYYGTQRLTTAAGTTVTPTLEALSAAEIIRRIRQL
ncbi:hypothetical protein [Hymenobacter negativus]|uniref:Uncharacterized protein n=1 Tax=Hymenobacter negativus TaxID=2795026 RepID=A0ABS0Q196_9BACT|nr:hypothetical protein [Hymenobacter negativus]MBH8556432.1 hypothetical protein [Hymenobacter negativus]